jgi:predicted ATP-dependent serine protease
MDVTLGRKISRGVLVTGTPGVGKSTFAYYFMRWLAQQGRAFVYDFGDTSGSRLRLWFDYTREEVAVLEGGPDAFRGGCTPVPGAF